MTQDELDAATLGLVAYVLESEELPREYVDAVMRATAALRVKGQLEAWQVAVAEGLGYLNRAEGQDGYEVASPEVIIRAWRTQEAELDALRSTAGQLVEALESEEKCECNRKGSRFSAYPCAACRERRRAAIKAAKETP